MIMIIICYSSCHDDDSFHMKNESMTQILIIPPIPFAFRVSGTPGDRFGDPKELPGRMLGDLRQATAHLVNPRVSWFYQ